MMTCTCSGASPGVLSKYITSSGAPATSSGLVPARIVLAGVPSPCVWRNVARSASTAILALLGWPSMLLVPLHLHLVLQRAVYQRQRHVQLAIHAALKQMGIRFFEELHNIAPHNLVVVGMQQDLALRRREFGQRTAIQIATRTGGCH